MIKTAGPSDKTELRELFHRYYRDHNGGFVSCLFQHYYSSAHTLLYKEDDRIVSALMCFDHVYSINGRSVKASFLLNPVTKTEVLSLNYQKQLMRTLLEDISQSELVTFIRTKDPSSYLEFGFEPLFLTKKVKLSREDIPFLNGDVRTAENDREIFECYEGFTRHFNGPLIYNEEQFSRYTDLVLSMSGSFLGYYEEGKLTAFAEYYQKQDECLVSMICYKGSRGIVMLLSELLRKNRTVTVNLSEKENLDFLDRDLKYESGETICARINDYPLWNRLFHLSATSAKEAYQLSGKPLYLKEYI